MQETKAEVMEFVDYLKDVRKFTALGARIPKVSLSLKGHKSFKSRRVVMIVPLCPTPSELYAYMFIYMYICIYVCVCVQVHACTHA